MTDRLMDMPAPLGDVLKYEPALGNSYLVGGCVRDFVMGFEPKDFDIEVYDVEYETLASALYKWGRLDVVGKSFGVMKLTRCEGKRCWTFDFTLPRLDSKSGVGHRGFDVKTDSNLTLMEAAARRDFTINALAYDWRTGEVIDNFGGLRDIEHGVLRAINEQFKDDPLRVLRGMQFSGRYNLTLHGGTAKMCWEIRDSYSSLPKERVWAEWFKWAACSVRPSRGLRFLMNCGWLGHFAEIDRLRGCLQEPEWHPEGDAFVHTMHCCDALAASPAWQNKDAEERATLMLAVLCHDLGKPRCTTTVLRNGVERIISPGHDSEGGVDAVGFLIRIGAPASVINQVAPLVECHMAHLTQPTYKTVRKLAHRLSPATIDQLILVIEADHSGRPPLPGGLPARAYEIAMLAAELDVQAQAPKPILMGRHLIELGHKPGAAMGRFLRKAFEAQLEGEFNNLDGAKIWLERELNE